MKANRTLLAGLLLTAFTMGLRAADAPLRYESGAKDNEMEIEGTATGHGWHVKGVIISGSFEVEPAWQKDPTLKSVTCLGEGKTPPNCELSIPVKSLKSQVAVASGVMDDRMRKEMREPEFSRIRYRLLEMKPVGEIPAAGTPVTFDTKGQLAIAGKTNTVNFQITMERLEGDKLCFKGTYKTKMTEFNIKPPEFTVLGIGSKTADDITLKWKWTLGLKPPAQ